MQAFLLEFENLALLGHVPHQLGLLHAVVHAAVLLVALGKVDLLLAVDSALKAI